MVWALRAAREASRGERGSGEAHKDTNKTSIYIYMYMCISLSLYTYIYIYMYICIFVCVYLSLSLYMYIYIYIYIHMHTYTLLYVYIHLYLYTYIYIYIYLSLYIYIYIDNFTNFVDKVTLELEETGQTIILNKHDRVDSNEHDPSTIYSHISILSIIYIYKYRHI